MQVWDTIPGPPKRPRNLSITKQLARLMRESVDATGREVLFQVRRKNWGMTPDTDYLYWIFEPVLEDLVLTLYHHQGYDPIWKVAERAFTTAPYYGKISPEEARGFIARSWHNDIENIHSDVNLAFSEAIHYLDIKRYTGAWSYFVTIFNYMINVRTYLLLRSRARYQSSRHPLWEPEIDVPVPAYEPDVLYEKRLAPATRLGKHAEELGWSAPNRKSLKPYEKEYKKQLCRITNTQSPSVATLATRPL